MKSTTWVRWALASLVFLAIGWAMRQYGLNTARFLLLLLLVLVYVYGGHGRQTGAGGGGACVSGVGGGVESLERVVDPVPRARRARVRVRKDAAVSRREMFMEAVIHVGLGKRLSVPKEAVIDTGTRHIVYVNTAPGHYAPRAVTLGREAEADVEVLAGLDAGERVAVSAQFLIDSESRLKAVLGGR